MSIPSDGIFVFLGSAYNFLVKYRVFLSLFNFNYTFIWLIIII